MDDNGGGVARDHWTGQNPSTWATGAGLATCCSPHYAATAQGPDWWAPPGQTAQWRRSIATGRRPIHLKPLVEGALLYCLIWSGRHRLNPTLPITNEKAGGGSSVKRICSTGMECRTEADWFKCEQHGSDVGFFCFFCDVLWSGRLKKLRRGLSHHVDGYQRESMQHPGETENKQIDWNSGRVYDEKRKKTLVL